MENVLPSAVLELCVLLGVPKEKVKETFQVNNLCNIARWWWLLFLQLGSRWGKSRECCPLSFHPLMVFKQAQPHFSATQLGKTL